MVTGGESYYGLKYETQPHYDIEGHLVSYDMGGLGLFSLNMYLDTHFGNRGRQGRLIGLIFDHQESTGALIGAGIDQNTALVIDGYHSLVLGEGGVTFIDLSSSKVSQ